MPAGKTIQFILTIILLIAIQHCMVVIIPGLSSVKAQTYGLRFSSHNVSKEARTSLDLTPDHYLSLPGDFELNFRFSLNRGEKMYFGYVVRMIDTEGRNLDLLYYYQSSARNGFEIVYGQNLNNHTARTNFAQLCQEGLTLKMRFNPNENELIFSTKDTTLVVSDVMLGKKLKILFGASDFRQFKTTDVPPMNVRDITLKRKEKILHYWPLDEMEGNYATDAVTSRKGFVVNPEWLGPSYHDWEKVSEFTLQGNAEFTADPAGNKLYFLGDNMLVSYSVPDDRLDSLMYIESVSVLNAGCQAFFDTNRNQIVTYNIDLKRVSTFDPARNQWTQSTSDYYPLTVFWHHNNYFNAQKDVLYTFNGYGQHEYKNTINRYSFATDLWDVVETRGDIHAPRYLSATGFANDSLYILGGYGSISGKQILNPQNFYDLWAYSFTGNTFTKLYEFTPPVADIVFANSMIIHEEKREFYVLGFPNFVYDNYLQLFRGSLDNPRLEAAGNTIPYMFHDIISFADLFYFEAFQRLYAVTSLFDENNTTRIQIFSLRFPPNKTVTTGSDATKQYNSFILILLAAFGLVLILVLFIFYQKGKPEKGKDSSLPPEVGAFEEPTRNVLIFFGEFQIFNGGGDDITHKFSPLLKELFLLIWFHTMKSKGISSERIIDILWWDKDPKNARNNLAVNITKLKHLLSELDSLTLSKKTGYWMISYDPSVIYNDYREFLDITAEGRSFTYKQVKRLSAIAHKGHFLESCMFSWLDEFKAEVANRIIDILNAFVETIDMESNSDLVISLSDNVLNFDTLNEEAILFKCKALTLQGKHHLAMESFQKFSKEYKTIYNIPYGKSFPDLIHNGNKGRIHK